MSTFLFDEIIFGPVKSRRLGTSLGVNLLPNDHKLCNFDCIYCECGWTPTGTGLKSSFHPVAEVEQAMREKLAHMQAEGDLPDAITFAGNGEPTMHPDFGRIIQTTHQLRQQYCPEAKTAVLSNGSLLHKPGVYQALQQIDRNILKLDSVFAPTVQQINNPLGHFSIQKVMEQYRQFPGELIIQTLFLRGHYKGQPVDNTTETEIAAWLQALDKIRPQEVMVYTIARDTPAPGLEKIPPHQLHAIAQRVGELGIPTQVAT